MRIDDGGPKPATSGSSPAHVERRPAQAEAASAEELDQSASHYDGSVRKYVFSRSLMGGNVLPPNYVGSDPATFPIFNQLAVDTENQNACGTTCLAMVMASEGAIPNTLAAARKIDGEARPWDGFSAPDDLIAYARNHGLPCVGRNCCNYDELTAYLAAGNKVMAYLDYGGSPHWIILVGIEKDQAGDRTLTIVDPWGGKGGEQQVYTWPAATFDDNWLHPNQEIPGTVLDELMGYSRYLLVFDKDQKQLPAARNFGIAYAETAADGVSDLGNAIPDLRSARPLSSAADAVAGPVKLVASIPGALGRLMEIPGDHALAKGAQLIEEGGFAKTLEGGALCAGGGLVKGVGWPVRMAGNVLATVGNAAGDVLQRGCAAVESTVAGLFGH
jgi:hypothetical protein